MLLGKLVRLRPLDVAEVDRFHAWVNDSDVVQFWGAELRYPVARTTAQDWLTKASLKLKPPELAIETLADSRYIGDIGLARLRGEDAAATLWILIGEKDCWNRGYGTDAILTLLRFAFDEMNLHRITLGVDDDHARAIACYSKCGFVEEGRLRQDRYKGGAYHDSLVMGILADEFRAMHPEVPV